MTEQTKCESGNGYKVVVDFGNGPTDCCTCTIAKFESLLIVGARERIRELEWVVEQHKDNALALQQRIRELESQSVPVVGEPVGFILLHENGGKNLTFHDNTGKLSDGWSQHKLVIHPTTPITAAELTTLHHLQ